jgi:signal transduction histidine kinase
LGEAPHEVRPPPLTRSFRVYATLVALITAVFLPAGLRAALAEPTEALLWAGFITAASFVAIPVLPRLGLEVSLGAPVSISAAVVLAPPLALLVNVVGFTGIREWRRQTSIWVSVFNRSQIGLSAGAAGLVATWVMGRIDGSTGILIATLLAVAVHSAFNTTFVAISMWARGQLGLQQAAARSQAPIPRFAIEYGLSALLALLIVITHQQVGPAAVLLIALPMGLGYSALRSARVAEDRAEELADQVRELETLNTAAVELLSARSAYHAASITRVALRTALDTQEVAVALDGDVEAQLQAVKVPGAEPAALAVPIGLPERSLAVVDAIGGLLGMTLQRQELEHELQAVERARAALSGRILEEGNRERSRIAIAIHDEVLPFLAGAEIQADNVRSAMHSGDVETADRLASATREAVHGGISHLREVIEALRRQVFVPGGLVDGLQSAVSDLRLRHGIDGILDVPEELPELPLAVEILLLETVRGCLTNVARHAGAEKVAVRMTLPDRMVAIEVADDGGGFDPSAVPEGHHGLVLMGQRVELARGRFRVESAHGEGTRVRVEVPL